MEFWLHSELPVALRPVAEPSRTWTTPESTVVAPSSSGTPIARSCGHRAAEVADGERRAEAVVGLGVVGDARRVLAPDL